MLATKGTITRVQCAYQLYIAIHPSQKSSAYRDIEKNIVKPAFDLAFHIVLFDLLFPAVRS